MHGEGQAPDVNTFPLGLMEATVVYALLCRSMPGPETIDRLEDSLQRQEVPFNARKVAEAAHNNLVSLRLDLRAHLCFMVGDEAVRDLERRALRMEG